MKVRRIIMLLFVVCFSITIFVVPASANQYHATFNYYVLNKTTNKYDYVSSASYSSSDSSGYSYDSRGSTFTNIGYNDAPAQYRTSAYTYRSEYTYNNRADVIYNYIFYYTFSYYFDPASFTVTYNIDGNSYKTEDHCYNETVSPLTAIFVKPGYTFSGWTSSDVTLSSGSFTMPSKNVILNSSYMIHSNLVKYQYTGSIPQNTPALPVSSNYNYGSLVHVASLPSVPGYTFSGWSTSNATVTNGNFSMPDTIVTLSGSWSANIDTHFAVEFYKED